MTQSTRQPPQETRRQKMARQSRFVETPSVLCQERTKKEKHTGCGQQHGWVGGLVFGWRLAGGEYGTVGASSDR